MNRLWAGFDAEDYYRAAQIAMGLLEEELDDDLDNEFLPDGGHRLTGLMDDHGISRIARELTEAEQRVKDELEGIDRSKQELAEQAETVKTFQVVSGEMFSNINEPVVRIGQKDILFNSNCAANMDNPNAIKWGEKNRSASYLWMLAYRPFPEGNERLARLLSNVILIRAGYTFFGNISISSVLAQTSYEYFRAIANILRTENGADLTYFLEYYLVSLSTAVSDMKTKRIQQAETVAEAEQKMAMVKLDDHLIHENVSQLEGSETEPVSGYERLKEALDSLRLRGYTQFTANDVREICGMSRKYVHTLLMRFEAEAKITIIRKSNTGNIYAFVSGRQDNTDSHHGETNKPTAIINDGTTGDSVSDTNSEETAETKEYVSELYSIEYIIQALQDGMTENNEIFAKIANQLIKYLKAGKQQFKVTEISAELDLHVSYIRGVIMWCRKKNLVEVATHKHKIFTYAFRTKISSFASANEQPDERSTVLFDKLNMLTSSDDEKVSLFAYIFLKFLYTGKQA